MPSYMTHHLFAKLLEHEIPSEGRTCFLYGTQGADLLYFSRALTVFRWDSLAKYGVALHQGKTRESIEFMSDILRRGRNTLVESYIKGYLCHYALDRTIHPFVYAQVGRMRERSGHTDTWCHLKIETNMDVLVLKELTGLNVRQYDCRHMFARDEASERAVAQLYTQMFHALFRKQIRVKNILECFKQRRIAVRLLYSPRRVKYNMLRFMFAPIRPAMTLLQLSHPNTADPSFDYVNRRRQSWVNPFTGEESNASVFDMFKTAEAEVRVMWDMLEANDFSGMNWLNFDGRPLSDAPVRKKRRFRRRK